MRPARHLVVFARAPRLGTVKRRLAAGIGELAAWRFYRATARGLLRRLARDRRWRCWLALTPNSSARRGGFRQGRRGTMRALPQGAGDLGRRMARVMRRLPPGPVVIVGSDVPAITAAHIARAFAALERADAVFGPAADGGYWLVGLRRARAGLFRGVRWSSETALADTLASLGSGPRVELLETLADIDLPADYARWRAAAGGRW